jgi:hypothetical protein
MLKLKEQFEVYANYYNVETDSVDSNREFEVLSNMLDSFLDYEEFSPLFDILCTLNNDKKINIKENWNKFSLALIQSITNTL